MPCPRPYVPSVAVLRALSRPSAPRCPLLPRLPTQFTRGKRKASKPQQSEGDPRVRELQALQKKLLRTGEAGIKARDAKLQERGIGLPDESLTSMGFPEMEFWEQDLDKPGKPMKLISEMKTRADLERHQKTAAMIEERDNNPDYDDGELNKRLIDDLIANPNFADLTEALHAFKATIKTKEEKEQMEREVQEELEPTEREMDAVTRMTIDQALNELLVDPDLVEYQRDVRAALQALPEGGDLDTPEFVAAMEDLESKLEGNEAYMAKLNKWKAEQEIGEDGMSEEMRKLEAMVDAHDAEAKDLNPELDFEAPANDMSKLLIQMRELLGAMNDDKSKEITSEIDALLNDEPDANEAPAEEDKELNFETLSEELQKIQENPTPTSTARSESEDPELEAKVDEIMKDPQLLEKLSYLTKLIQENKPSLTNPDVEFAPDPSTLPDSEMTTLQAQLKIAENTPEHIAALRRLRVNLVPPFHISPALNSFNRALKIAYCCSNDPVRRIVWRSYFKARSLPTFLQNITNDAWDMVYYTQAVTWRGNENRTNHLRIILEDMRSVGLNGPPTHPSTLKKAKKGRKQRN